MNDTKIPVSLALVFFLAVMAYLAGYWGGAQMATAKCEKAIEQLGGGYSKQIAECTERLESCEGAALDYTAEIETRLLPLMSDLDRLSNDLFFDFLQCRGGDQVMFSACEIDENCSNCLAQHNADDRIGDIESYDWCVKHALHDKNEWYDLMGLPYYDGCAWDMCVCADDEFIASNPDVCTPELLEYYNK